MPPVEQQARDIPLLRSLGKDRLAASISISSLTVLRRIHLKTENPAKIICTSTPGLKVPRLPLEICWYL